LEEEERREWRLNCDAEVESWWEVSGEKAMLELRSKRTRLVERARGVFIPSVKKSDVSHTG